MSSKHLVSTLLVTTILLLAVALASPSTLAQPSEENPTYYENASFWWTYINFTSNPLIGSGTLFFGAAPDATDGFDDAYDIPMPPPPPGNATYARFAIDEEPYHLYVDFKANSSTMTWTLELWYAYSEDANVTFAWSQDILFELLAANYSSMFIVPSELGGGAINMTELSQCNVTIPGTDEPVIYTFQIVVSTADTAPPVLIIKYPWNNTYIRDNKPTISVIAYDAGSGINESSIIFKINGTAKTPVIDWIIPGKKCFINYTPPSPLADARYEVYVEVVDNADNVANITWYFMVDTALPTIQVLEPAKNNSIFAEPQPIRARISDNFPVADFMLFHSYVEFYINGSYEDMFYDGDGISSWTIVNPRTIEFYFNTPEYYEELGNYTFIIHAYDLTGNAVNKTWTFIVVNVSPPIITSITPKPDSCVNTDTFWVNASIYAPTGVNDSSIVIKFDDTDVTSHATFIWVEKPYNLTVAYLAEDVPDCNHTVYIYAEENTTGLSAEYEWNFTVDTTPPTVEIHKPAEGAFTMPGNLAPISLNASVVDNKCKAEYINLNVTLILPDDTVVDITYDCDYSVDDEGVLWIAFDAESYDYYFDLEGEYKYVINATDCCNNSRVVSVSFVVASGYTIKDREFDTLLVTEAGVWVDGKKESPIPAVVVINCIIHDYATFKPNTAGKIMNTTVKDLFVAPNATVFFYDSNATGLTRLLVNGTEGPTFIACDSNFNIIAPGIRKVTGGFISRLYPYNNCYVDFMADGLVGGFYFNVTFDNVNVTAWRLTCVDSTLTVADSTLLKFAAGASEHGSSLDLWNVTLIDKYLLLFAVKGASHGNFSIANLDEHHCVDLQVSKAVNFFIEKAAPPALYPGYTCVGCYALDVMVPKNLTTGKPIKGGKVSDLKFLCFYNGSALKVMEVNESQLKFYTLKGTKWDFKKPLPTSIVESSDMASTNFTKPIPAKPKPKPLYFALMAPVKIPAVSFSTPLMRCIVGYPGKHPMGLFIDKKGNLWIADPTNQTIWEYLAKPKKGQSPWVEWNVSGYEPHVAVFSTKPKPGVIWFSSLGDSSLYGYSLKTLNVSTEIDLDGPIFDMALDKKGNLWVTVNDSMLYVVVPKKMFTNGSVDYVNYTMELPSTPSGLAIAGSLVYVGLPDEEMIAAFQLGKKGIVWKANYTVNASPTFLAIGKKAIWFTDMDNQLVGVLIFGKKGSYTVENFSTAGRTPLGITVDRKGVAWFVFAEGGMGYAYYNKKLKDYDCVLLPPGMPAYDIVAGKKGMWISHPGNGTLSFYPGKGVSNMYCFSPVFNFTSVVSDGKGTFWAYEGNYSFIVGIDAKRFAKNPEKYPPLYVELPKGFTATAMAISKKGELWLGGKGALTYMYPKKGSVATYDLAALSGWAIPRNFTPASIGVDKKGGVWAVDPALNMTLFFMPPKGKRPPTLAITTEIVNPIKVYVTLKGATMVLTNTTVYAVSYNKKTGGIGVDKIVEVSDAPLSDIAVDKKGFIWVVCNNTMLRLYDKRGNFMTNVPMPQLVYSIAIDQKNNLWIQFESRAVMVVAYKVGKTGLTSFNVVDCLGAPALGFFMDAKGNAWFAAANCITGFDMKAAFKPT